MQEQKLTFAELMKLSGLKETLLRRYVMLGLIEPLGKGRRRRLLFDRRAVRRAKLIYMLNKSGYTLEEIRRIFIDSRRRNIEPSRVERGAAFSPSYGQGSPLLLHNVSPTLCGRMAQTPQRRVPPLRCLLQTRS